MKLIIKKKGYIILDISYIIQYFKIKFQPNWRLILIYHSNSHQQLIIALVLYIDLFELLSSLYYYNITIYITSLPNICKLCYSSNVIINNSNNRNCNMITIITVQYYYYIKTKFKIKFYQSIMVGFFNSNKKCK